MTASAADRSHTEKRKMTVSERSIGALTAALQDWLASRSAGPGRPVVSGVRMPDTGGLSSTSVLFEATWASAGTEQHGSYVARMAPEGSAVPVFPRYDLPAQFEVISRVATCCGIPLPKLERAGRRRARHPVFRHGPGRRPDTAGQPAICVHRLAA